MIILKGNHENMLERYLRDKSTKEIWAQNRSGGHATLKELYALHGEDLKYEQQLLEWVEKLPLYVEITVLERTYLLTHAGIGEELFLKYCKCNQYKKSHQIDLVNLFDWVMQHSDSDKNEILWDKGIFQLKEINIKDNLIIGHTPTEEMKIMRSKNIFNIDCGSYKKGGKLGCLCLDTLQEIYTNCN
jgi:serine/threonine protein phosphatase 1